MKWLAWAADDRHVGVMPTAVKAPASGPTVSDVGFRSVALNIVQPYLASTFTVLASDIPSAVCKQTQ